MSGWKKGLALLVGAGLVVAFVVRDQDTARAALRLLASAELWPLAVALGLQVGYYVCAGIVVRQCLRLVDFDVPFWWTVRATFLLIFVSRIVPGPAATGPAAMYYLLERRGLSRARAAIVGPLFYAVDFSVFFLFLAVGLFTLAVRRELTGAVLAALPLLAAFAVIAIVVLRLLRAPDRLEATLARLLRVVNRVAAALRIPLRAPETVAPGLARTVAEMRQRLQSHPGIGARLAVAGVAMMLCDVATMAFAFRAFGVWLHVSVAFLGFCLATAGAIVSFLPGGLGTFEAAMVLGFTGLGAPRAATLAATVLYRVIATWLPALLGLVAYHGFLSERGGEFTTGDTEDTEGMMNAE